MGSLGDHLPRLRQFLGAADAEAAGDAAVLIPGTSEPWQPAALRGSAGLHFALPVARIDSPPDRGRPLVAIDPEGEALGEGGRSPTLLLLARASRVTVYPSLQETLQRGDVLVIAGQIEQIGDFFSRVAPDGD